MRIEEDKVSPTIIDLGAARKNEINESFLRQFGELVKIALRRMFGTEGLSGLVRGTQSEINSFSTLEISTLFECFLCIFFKSTSFSCLLTKLSVSRTLNLSRNIF